MLCEFTALTYLSMSSVSGPDAFTSLNTILQFTTRLRELQTKEAEPISSASSSSSSFSSSSLSLSSVAPRKNENLTATVTPTPAVIKLMIRKQEAWFYDPALLELPLIGGKQVSVADGLKKAWISICTSPVIIDDENPSGRAAIVHRSGNASIIGAPFAWSSSTMLQDSVAVPGFRLPFATYIIQFPVLVEARLYSFLAASGGNFNFDAPASLCTAEYRNKDRFARFGAIPSGKPGKHGIFIDLEFASIDLSRLQQLSGRKFGPYSLAELLYPVDNAAARVVTMPRPLVASSSSSSYSSRSRGSLVTDRRMHVQVTHPVHACMPSSDLVR